MKASEMTFEQRADYEARLAERLERADEVSADTAAWLAERRADGSAAEERHAERRQREESARAASQQPQPVSPIRRAPASPAMDAETAAGWNRWAEAVVNRKLNDFCDKTLGPVCEEIGATIGKAERRVMDLESRLAKSEEATVSLLMELERRLAGLEKRAVLKPVRPKLVGNGGDDVA